jgi:hypothetical protein
MAPKVFSRLNGLSRFFFICLCAACACLVLWVNVSLTTLQAKNRAQHLPFGVFSLPDGTIVAQDFAYNLLFLKGIQERLVSHPYRLEDQEKLMRRMVPEGTSGMTHAYSPVAFVLALPLLSISGGHAYLLYTILCAVGILLLFYFYLLPLVESPLQIHAFLACTISVCLIAAFTVGQSALITTTFLGAFWCLLKRRAASSSILIDSLIAALFWALCLKPGVALIPLALLLGARAWRPLALGLLLLLATWLCVADYYGGWWTGLGDYLHLLNHYHNADFTPFMQRGHETADEKHLTSLLFTLDRGLILISCLTLLILRWTRRITGSEQFQGMVWAFLLLSPYLLPSENWVMCLLVVEGSFFQSKNPVVIAGKLLLLCAILDLRPGVTFPWPVDAYFKWLLLVWIVVEWLRAGRLEMPKAKTRSSKAFSSLVAQRDSLR